MADETDLKSVGEQSPCGFESHHRHSFMNPLNIEDKYYDACVVYDTLATTLIKVSLLDKETVELLIESIQSCIDEHSEHGSEFELSDDIKFISAFVERLKARLLEF
jgi:hypothetical protein